MTWLKGRIRFDRHELAGSFGDIGTDLPLILGLILACGLDGASSFILFGAMQVFTGLMYGLPIPVQPLKVMAVIAIAASATPHKITPDILYGGGLAVGAMMLLLTLTGLLSWIARQIPHSVVRGLQLGLGISLSMLALRTYVPAESGPGYALAAAAFAIVILLRGNRRLPAALVVVAVGAVYALVFKLGGAKLDGIVGLAGPKLHLPMMGDIWQGLVLLALPQLALSIGNSVIATEQTVRDLFPDRRVSVRKIGLTYSIMNLVQPFLSGIPTCHGSGGLAGHYAFGARTGGSVIIYGSMYLAVGLFLSKGFNQVMQIFPLPILGVILLFEALALMSLARDITRSKADLLVALVVALPAALTTVGLPNGFLIGLALGLALAYVIRKRWVMKSER